LDFQPANRPIGLVAVFSDVTEVERLRNARRDLLNGRVEQLIRAYREHGHTFAHLNPLKTAPKLPPASLSVTTYGLENELDTVFTVARGQDFLTAPLHEIIRVFQGHYTGALGIQYSHVDDPEIRQWLCERIENPDHHHQMRECEQLRTHKKLLEAEVFETFAQRAFAHTKRFSLEGAETLIPLIDQVFELAAAKGCSEIVIGMSHRGRLNVLANLLGLSYGKLFELLADRSDMAGASADVPVHLGAESTVATSSGTKLKVSLCFNPSHLECVGPVVLGRVRARQDASSGKGQRVLPLIIHGDAAFAGQGVVQETLNLAELPAYTTDGAVHVVVNNQIGFTTLPTQGRSTRYPTDVAKMRQIPILHVNGESPEAVNRAVRIALDFWQKWRQDVIIDAFCFRRRGHMELDDPTMTQPLLYQRIAERPPLQDLYRKGLSALGCLSEADCQQMRAKFEAKLNAALLESASTPQTEPQTQAVADRRANSRPNRGQIKDWLEALSRLPSNFSTHPKIGSMLKRRARMALGKVPIDWGTAEALAFCSLMHDGISVRLTGQDSERGTFAHRHANLHDQKTGETYQVFESLGKGLQGQIYVANSPLSEAAVLAFEYGYDLDHPSCLTIWEAQFGDFANGAQTIIDQFIASGKDKWGVSGNLTMLLPHGLEGHGPEHSSARPERFLQLCANNNLNVAAPSSAAQYYHLLRRQATQMPKRPLIVFTPKRLLQGAATSSPLEVVLDDQFQPIRVEGNSPKAADRLVICYGRFGHELSIENRKRNHPAAIVRLEQLHPFPADAFKTLSTAPVPKRVLWAQEEPENMGPWHHLRYKLEAIFSDMEYVARPVQSSPAGGSLKRHDRETVSLVEQVFGT
jgi:2-oxoglutarate dehydrogenase E1 component